MGRLFVQIVGGHDRDVTLGVWYSSYSDRSQRQMLEAAIKASSRDTAWERLPTNAKDDLLWLMDGANDFARIRNEAIHAPCSLIVDEQGSAMAANIMSGHRRAKSLTGKQVLTEFDRLERYAEALARFTYGAWLAMTSDNATWPQKPSAPNRRPRKELQGRLR
jgi:hypothetical protein